MEPDEYDYLHRLEDTLWWFVGMRRIVYQVLRRHVGEPRGSLRVLDAGCGTGGSLPLLERFGTVTAFDFYPKAAFLAAARRPGRVFIGSIDAIPLADASFDLVTAFDVICQLPPPQDEAALREMARVTRPGGSVLVRVPAYQALAGPHDATLQTQHRYSAGEVREKVRRAELEPVWTSYANTLLFPVAAVRRLWAKRQRGATGQSDVRPVPAALNGAFCALLSLEAQLVKRAALPFGLSVLAVARRP